MLLYAKMCAKTCYAAHVLIIVLHEREYISALYVALTAAVMDPWYVPCMPDAVTLRTCGL